MTMNRRQFLQASLGSMAYFTAARTVPAWVANSAAAIRKSLPTDRILVIVQQAGGNDGLNTIIPYADDLYMGDSLRPNLHITSGFTVLDGLNAMNPRLSRLAQWYLDGKMAVVQNVGYPNPDYSHFVSTDFWERGNSPGSTLVTYQGWLSRYFDNKCAGTPANDINALSMLAGGLSVLPGTLDGSDIYRPPAVPKFDTYQLRAPGNAQGQHRLDYIDAIARLGAINSDTDFLQRTTITAEASIADLATASAIPVINPYPAGSLGTGLDMVSKVIRAGFETPIYYVSQGGYDTHANQFGVDPATTGDHPELLDTFDQALDAFLKDMQVSGNLDRVLVLTFSEFGRRVSENFSHGTDHGAGNCLFAFGGKVHGGIYGGQPDLSNLIQGNLIYKIDFRSVYARVLRDWMDIDPAAIFGDADFNNPAFSIPVGMATAAFLTEIQKGDVDRDGDVAADDIQMVINKALGRPVNFNTDIDGDGDTDASDIQAVISAVLSGK